MAAPTPAPHVPVNFLKAGDMGGFSADCVAALAQCGYAPEDFGSHEHVANECAQARIRRQEYVARQAAAGQPVDPHGPDARTAMLAQCNSSHLSQNALFQGGERNDSCANHPTAPGYHCNMAPAMPVQAFAPDSNTAAPGSNHELVSDNERLQNQRAGAGNAVNANQLSVNARENAAIATGTDAKTGAPVNVPAASEARAAALASGPSGAGGGSAAGGAGSISGSTAAECIEAYRQAAMTRMGQQVDQRYGAANYGTTQAANQTRADNASAAVRQFDRDNPGGGNLKQANDRIKKFGGASSLKPHEQKQLEAARQTVAAEEQRKQDRGRLVAEQSNAQQELRNGGCIHQQLSGLGGPPSFNTGIAPSGG